MPFPCVSEVMVGGVGGYPPGLTLSLRSLLTVIEGRAFQTFHLFSPAAGTVFMVEILARMGWGKW